MDTLLQNAESAMVLAGLPLIPLVIFLVQQVKRFFPRASNNVWYGLAFGLGLVGETITGLLTTKEWTLATVTTMIVMALVAGVLAAGKVYDELAKRGKIAHASELLPKA